MSVQKQSACDQLNNALRNRWSCYLKCLQATRKSQTPKAVHSLRVSLRRLRAIVGLLREIHDSAALGTLGGLLKETQDCVRELHDLQVQEKRATKESPSERIAGFAEDLTKRRKRAQKRASKALRSVDAKKQARLIEHERRWFAARSKKIAFQKQCCSTLKIALAAHARRFKKKARRATMQDPRSVHSARIALKKLRYAAEALDLLFPMSKKTKRELKVVQKTLGNAQDAVVRGGMALDFLTSRSPMLFFN